MCVCEIVLIYVCVDVCVGVFEGCCVGVGENACVHVCVFGVCGIYAVGCIIVFVCVIVF